jgi:hypothetical protein
MVVGCGSMSADVNVLREGVGTAILWMEHPMEDTRSSGER